MHSTSRSESLNRSLICRRKEHQRNEKICLHNEVKTEEWTKVISRREARKRKKTSSESSELHKKDTRDNLSSNHLNWRHKEDITSYYFSNFTDGVNEVRLWEKFKAWGDVREIFIAKRLNKVGRRFGFVRFKGVSDAKFLETQLDNIFIDDLKLFVNLPRFARSATNLENNTNT